jgi:hypothetical protein
MTSRIRRVESGVGRPIILRVALVMLIAGLISGRASADDIVLKWNEIAARTAAAATSPFNQARIMAITQLAVFEAVNAVTGDYERYLDTPIPASPGASVDAAVIVAAHKVADKLLPAAAAALNTARDADLGAIPAVPPRPTAWRWARCGECADRASPKTCWARQRMDRRRRRSPIFRRPRLPGDYQLTTGCASSAFYNWPGVTPFAIGSPADFLLPPPPSRGSQQYTKDYYEVHTVGAKDSADRPADRTANSRLWAGTSPNFALSMVTRQISVAKGLSLSENARNLALIMMGINDSLIASFYNKYHYNLWRPETGIRNGASDDNGKTEGDTGFTTFISTRVFPAIRPITPAARMVGSRS